MTTVHGGASLYGLSYAAIRSVASGGKVCLVALDTRGAETLYNDDRIDAAFVYVNAPSWQELETRVANRLKEHESTIQKRIAWAREEVRSGKQLVTPSLVDRTFSYCVSCVVRVALAYMYGHSTYRSVSNISFTERFP